MRVLFVTHSFPRYEGDGAGEFILRLATALVAAGCVVKVLAPSAPGLAHTDSIQGVTVERFRYAPRAWETLAYTGTMAEQVSQTLTGKAALLGLIICGSRAIGRAVHEFRPDIVHAHWWFPLGISAAFGAGITPLVVTSHGSDLRLATKSHVAPAIFRFVSGRARAFTAVSSWLARIAESLAPGLKARVAPMPVDVALFTPGADQREPTLLFVGRLNSQKGVADVLQALKTVPANVTLDIVGDGPDRVALESLARELQVNGRVRWHGHLAQAAVAPMYRAAFAVVIPSREEGLGLVAVESLLSETPVVAYRSGGLTDLITDGNTGRLVDEGSVEQLSTACNALLSAPSAARALGAEGRRQMLVRFAPATAATAYLRVYREAMAP